MPPLLIRTSLVQALRSFAADLSVAPQSSMVASGKSVVSEPIQLSTSSPLSAIEAPGDVQSALSGSRAKALIDVSWGNTAVNEVHNSISPPSNPIVTLPEFAGQWFSTDNADLSSLTHLVASSLFEEEPYENDNSMGPQMLSGDGDWGDDWGYHLDNNDGYTLTLNTVTFSGTKFTPVYRDLAQTEYAPPHWVDSLNHNNRDDRTENLPVGSNLPGKDMGEPVSFGMASQMVATISANLHYLPPGPLQPIDNFPNDRTVFLRGITYYDITKPAIYSDVIVVGDPKSDMPLNYQLTFTNLMSTVYHWADMDIDWQYAYANYAPLSNSTAWNTFNTSHNANYITLDKAAPNMTLFLTLAYYGTLHAHGESSVAGTVQKMWEGSFKDATGTIRAEDAKPLCYYGRWLADNNRTVPDLLSSKQAPGGAGDGNCEAFAQLWIEFLKSEGITTGQLKQMFAVTKEEGFLVNAWTDGINTKNLSNNFLPYEWCNRTTRSIATFFEGIVENNTDKRGKHDFNSEEVRSDLPGLAGQNQPNPPSLFLMHAVVEFLGVLWDPSYGKTYINLPDFETRAITGYFVKEFHGQDRKIFIRNKDTDPNTAEVEFR